MVACGVVLMSSGAEPGPGLSVGQVRAASALRADGVTVNWCARLGTPVRVRGADLDQSATAIGARVRAVVRQDDYPQRAIALLDALSGLYRTQDASEAFAVKRIERDALGHRHVRLAQVHRELPVTGGDLLVHFDAAGKAYEVTGDCVPGIELAITPRLSGADATAAARGDLKAKGRPQGVLEAGPELVIHTGAGLPALAYELALGYSHKKAGVALWRYWVDAQTGDILNCYDDVQSEDVSISGNILPREGGTLVTVTGWHEAGSYYLQDRTVNYIVRDQQSVRDLYSGVWSARTSASWGNADPAAVSGAYNIRLALQYFANVHGRNSFDNAGAQVIVNVHHGQSYNNAFWHPTPKRLYFGDGDGTMTTPASVLDVVVHELTHAVTSHSANLRYQNESGALNESFSDIFAACVEFAVQPDGRHAYPNSLAGHSDWLFGEEWLAADLKRDIRNPRNAALRTPQPSRYKGTHWYTGTGDNGGVHYNNSVQSHAFYLMSEGGTGNNDGIAYSVSKIGITNAAKVAYRALTVYCTVDTDHAAARLAWESAARDLNASWVPTIQSAWAAVGVGQAAPAVVMPAFNPPAGAYSSAVTVTVTTATSGAEIRYTLDGGEPTTASTLYTAPIAVAADATIKAKAFKAGVQPSATASAAYTFLGTRLYAFLVDDTSPGWATQGQWAFGRPTGGGGSTGPTDPSGGHTGNNAYGYNLNGDYANNIAGTHWLTAGPLNFSAASNVKLAFWRWLGVEEPAYDKVYLDVSKDGAAWTRVWQNTSRMGYGESDSVISDWSQYVYDISAVADRQATVYVRWGLGPTDGSTVYCGWNIDDVEFWGRGTPGGVVPAAPANLVAAAVASNHVRLAWQDKSDNEQGFIIQRVRQVDATGFAEIARVGANSTSYDDRTVAPKNAYNYRVAAYNTTGNSDFSNVSTVTTPDQTGDNWDPTDDTGDGATQLAAATQAEQSHGPHTLSGADGADWFKLHLTAGSSYNFNTAGGSGDTYGELFRDSTAYHRVGSDDDSAGNRQFSLTVTPDTTGTYYLRVKTQGASPEAVYTLRYRVLTASSNDAWDPGDDSGAGATALPAPTAAVQTHGEHTLSPTDAADWFKVQLAAGTLYNFHTMGGSGDIIGELFSDAGGTTRVAMDDDSGGSGQFSLIYTAATTDWYYLKVRSRTVGGNARYTLSYSSGNDAWDPGDDDPSVAPTAITNASHVQQSHGPHRLSATDQSDYFAVWLVYGEDYDFNSIGGTGDLYIRMWHWDGAQWHLLLEDDDSGGNRQFDLKARNNLADGWYYLQVSTYNAGENAQYSLNYTGGKDPWDPADNTGGGATALGTPDENGTAHGPHTLTWGDHYDWYRIDMTEGMKYYMTTYTGTGDTLAGLYADPGGTQLLASDDDSGGNYQMAIAYVAASSAPHYLMVRCYTLGNYARYPLYCWQAVDGDGDGMPDRWERTEFGSVGAANAQTDHDRDGSLDREELIAGTEANDSNSVFKCMSIRPVPGVGNVITWPSVADRLYGVERAPSLSLGFAPVAAALPATAPMNTYTDNTAAAGSHYYRLNVQQKP